MTRVLIVEDEPAIAELVSLILRHDGYEVKTAATSSDAEDEMRRILPDAVIVDWMLPGESGLALIKRMRADARTRETPFIMLTARSEEADKVAGLDGGADDYLTKPFTSAELLARIRAVLRRRAPEAVNAAVSVAGLTLDPLTRRVHFNGIELKFGPTEFRLLRFLMNNPERVHSRTQLLDRVWGDHVFIEERTVDVHIKRLRSVLEEASCAQLVETVRGAGYRLVRQLDQTTA